MDKSLYRRPMGGQVVKLLFSLTIFVSSAHVFAQRAGTNSGGGGGVRPGKVPALNDISMYLERDSAVRVLGYIYSNVGAAKPKTTISMAQKLAAGLSIEIRTHGPCLDGAGAPRISSIFSEVADICFNPKLFIEQKDVTITRGNFKVQADALLLHEILHLVQRDDHGSINDADEAKAQTLQEEYIALADNGARPSDAQLREAAKAAHAILELQSRNGSMSEPPLRVQGQSDEENRRLCTTAQAYLQNTETLLLMSVGVIVNSVHLIPMSSDYWDRDHFMWRAAFKSEDELDVLTERPRGKAYQITPSFIQIAQMIRDYHCSGSKAFSNWQEQTYSSKADIYDSYRDLMFRQVGLIAERTWEVFKARFILE